MGRFGGWAAVVLGLTAVLAACGVAGGSADGDPAEWWLADATPDGQVLEVATLGGGCSEFVGWVSEADDERVHLQARWESTDADLCDLMLRVETLVLDLTEPLDGRELSGCGHGDCLALPAEGDEHQSFPARLGIGGPGAVVSGPADVWGVEPEGTITWQRPHDGNPESVLDELDVLDEQVTDSEASDPGSGDTARLEFDGEGTWLETVDSDTDELRHRIRVTDPEAPVGPPVRLDDTRVVLGQQQPDRLWVVDLNDGDIRELSAGAGRVQGVVDGVVIVESETRTRAIDPDADEVLWESPRASGGERFVIGNGALVAFDRDLGSISLLDPRRGDVVWTAKVGTAPGVEVAALADRLLVTSSTTLFAFDAASGESHGWTALVPERAETVGGTHPSPAGR
ncbi:MAG: hypothetical protein EA340_10010 [Nitriliruptor sp.]|nr:MAG: hypothetical protein EA340_10010 [Nitriliruptor sp.]